MCMTEYLTESADRFVVQAQERIDVIDYIIPHLLTAQARAECAQRAAGLVAMLLAMHAELSQEKAAALRTIAEATALKRQTKEIGS